MRLISLLEKLAFEVTTYAPPGLAFRIPIGPLKGSLWIPRSGISTNAMGIYEPYNAEFMAKNVKKNSVFYDIGASAGYFTILASHSVGRNGKVIAFEPNPLNISCLRRHIELNKLENVEVIEAAVSNVDGMLAFDPVDSRIGRLKGKLTSSGNLMVRSVRLDDLINSGLPIPNYMKLDIEGAEFDALDGAKRTLLHYPVELFLSTHGNDIRLRCMKLLNELGYGAVPISGQKSELYCRKVR